MLRDISGSRCRPKQPPGPLSDLIRAALLKKSDISYTVVCFLKVKAMVSNPTQQVSSQSTRAVRWWVLSGVICGKSKPIIALVKDPTLRKDGNQRLVLSAESGPSIVQSTLICSQPFQFYR